MNDCSVAGSPMLTSPHAAMVVVLPWFTYTRSAGPSSVSRRTTMFTSAVEPATIISPRSVTVAASRLLSPSMYTITVHMSGTVSALAGAARKSDGIATTRAAAIPINPLLRSDPPFDVTWSA